MPRNRFDELRSCICFSKDIEKDEKEANDAQRRWASVQDFAGAINHHRSARVVPSDLICVDESMPRRHGLGGSWMDVGLPHYVAIGRKPESGCELQTAACGRSGIMLSVEIVMAEEDCEGKLFEGDYVHATAAARRLSASWARAERIVASDSHFAPVGTAEALDKAALKFIDCVRNATVGFPMMELAEAEATARGFVKAMTCRRIGRKDMMALEAASILSRQL